MTRTVRLRRTYPHPPSLVWEGLTDPELLAQWLMPNDFRPALGHRFTMRTEPQPGFDGVVHAEVLALDPPRRMRWSWKGGPVDSTVEFVLEPTADGGTTLHLEHAGFTGLNAVLVSFILGSGWAGMLRNRLPVLFDALARGERPTDLKAAMARNADRGWRRIAAVVSPILRRRIREPGSR